MAKFKLKPMMIEALQMPCAGALQVGIGSAAARALPFEPGDYIVAQGNGVVTVVTAANMAEQFVGVQRERPSRAKLTTEKAKRAARYLKQTADVLRRPPQPGGWRAPGAAESDPHYKGTYGPRDFGRAEPDKQAPADATEQTTKEGGAEA